MQQNFGSKQLFLGLSSQAKKLFFAFLNRFNNEIRLCLDRIKLNNWMDEACKSSDLIMKSQKKINLAIILMFLEKSRATVWFSLVFAL